MTSIIIVFALACAALLSVVWVATKPRQAHGHCRCGAVAQIRDDSGELLCARHAWERMERETNVRSR